MSCEYCGDSHSMKYFLTGYFYFREHLYERYNAYINLRTFDSAQLPQLTVAFIANILRDSLKEQL